VRAISAAAQNQVTEQRAIICTGLSYRGDVQARRHQHMNRSLRVNVRKRVAEVVLEDGSGGNGSVDDLAEEASS